MSKTLQFLLLIVAIVTTLALLVAIVLTIGATTHGSTPARVVHVTAGPYTLKLSLYDNPANAGFALPFALAPEQPVSGTLTYTVSSIPDYGVDATPIKATFSADPNVHGGVQGNAEITVRGQWDFHITVSGPSGQGEADVPITATAPPAIPDWLGWIIGLIPVYGILAFLLVQHMRRRRRSEHVAITQ